MGLDAKDLSQRFGDERVLMFSMTNYRYIRSAVVASVVVSFLAAQFTAAAVLPARITHHNVRASHHTGLRDTSVRRFHAKSLTTALPVSFAYRPQLRTALILAPVDSPEAVIRRAGTCLARSPPLS